MTRRLRKVLQSREGSQPIELLLDLLGRTRSNAEFLMQIAQSTPA